MTNKHRSNSSLAQPESHERGMASIIVTLIMMVIISLIIVGFAAVSRREQRQSIDQQLSTQAFYAAESGIEDAKGIIKRDLAVGAPFNKDKCDENNPGATYPTGNATVLSDTDQISYSCLKVDVAPKNALYNGVGDGYVVAPINTNSPIDAIEVTWQPSSSATGAPSNDCPNGTTNVFTPQPDWTCRYGVLRFDLVPLNGSLTRASMQNGAMTTFAVPSGTGGAGTVDYSIGRAQPNVVAATCDTAAYTTCKTTVSNLGGGTKYVLRISSIYRNSDVSVVASNGGGPLNITGAQAVIDATGRAQDVLRRIQVRMPLTVDKAGSAPTYAIQTNSAICKRFQVSPTYFMIPGDIIDRDTSNPMCEAKTSGSP